MSDKKFYIVITVDANDADYNTSFNTITVTQLERIRPLIEKIKNFEPYTVPLDPPIDPYGGCPMTKITHDHNYPYNYMCRENLGEKTVQELYSDINEETIEEFEELLPYCENDFHTIKSIELIPYVETIKLI